MNASQILAIPITRPDLLFKDLSTVDIEYKTFAMAWHPDKNKAADADKVFAHINALHDLAVKSAKNGNWGYTNQLVIIKKDGTKARYPYITSIPFELGTTYLTDTSVILEVESKYDNLVHQFGALTKFHFPDKKMGEIMKVYLPKDVRTLYSKDYIYIRMDRMPNQIRLADIMAKQTLDHKHVAWICSRLYNIACYLEFAKIKHLDISAESIFIDPESHTASLLNGWFYAGDENHENISIPVRMNGVLSNVKTTDLQTLHSTQIKILGRKLLGVNSIGQLRINKTIPDNLKSWFSTGPMKNPVEEYSKWRTTLEGIWGPRKFTKLELIINDIYS